MKKIMFNDRYGLTKAALEGRKTMTRRIIPDREAKRLDSFYGGDDWYYAVQTCIDDSSRFDIGEVVAVAQKYKDLPNPFAGRGTTWADAAGWENKMFVKAEDMPHRIKITDIKVERLQDISEEDCLKEGIVAGELKHEHPKEFVRTPMPYGCFLPFSFIGADTDYYCAKDAFAALIDKVSGKGTWERNPWVFVYSFKLIDQ